MHPLIEEELVLVQGGGVAGETGPVPFKDLKELSLVLPSRRHGLRSIVGRAAEQYGIEITPSRSMRWRRR